MSEYIIAGISGDDRFIQYDRLGKLCITSRKDKATRFKDAGKAWRTIVNQMSKKKRENWKVIAYDMVHDEEKISFADTPQRFRADIDMTSVSDESFDWEKVRRDITQSFAEIITYKERLLSKLTRMEAELCDCEHACEFFKCDAAQGYKLYKMIRERRIKRRFYKDELRKASSVLEMSYSDIANGKIEAAFIEIGKQTYEPRVLKELFSDAVQSINMDGDARTSDTI